MTEIELISYHELGAAQPGGRYGAGVVGPVVGTGEATLVVLVVDVTGAVVVVEMAPGAARPTVVLVDVAPGATFLTPSCAGCVTVTVLVELPQLAADTASAAAITARFGMARSYPCCADWARRL